MIRTARTVRCATTPTTPAAALAATLATALTGTALAAVGLVLAAGPAAAGANPLAPQEGADTHAQISTGTALLLFGLVPLGLMLVLSAIVWLPGAVRSSRYRPQRGWTSAPVWFAGPADPVAAVEAASVDASVRGGASGDW